MSAIHLADLITALSDPDAYPHPVSSLHFLQTHTSCVFLTGPFVYKVKKPVNFGFLDYSTLEKRRHFCEQELILNRRLCPDVYLGVVPIGRQNGRLCAGARGTPLEWALQMRQLPEEDMLPARLSAGTAAPVHIKRIAEILADFHANASRDPAIASFGEPESIAVNVEENFAQTESRTGDALPAEHLRAVSEYSRRFLAEQRDLFLARIRDGRIRDGHGDLRAQNICLHAGLQGGIQILDRIEFNDRFRYGDVAADLAYLAMDLDLAGRTDLRRALVGRYIEVSADAGLCRVLPFYQCYRAYVRGKIALLAAEEAEIPPHERQIHGELAAAAFDLARSYAAHRGSPALLITVGFSGSGKSVLAREVARRLPAVRIATDDVRKELAGVSPTVRLPEERYGADEKKQVYQEIFRQAQQRLAQGEHVILDGTFLSAYEREAAAALALAAGAEFWILECRCPDEVIRRRLAERSRKADDPSDADVAVYQAQVRAYEPHDETCRPGPLHFRRLKADTDQPAAVSARGVLRAFWGTDRSIGQPDPAFPHAPNKSGRIRQFGGERR